MIEDKEKLIECKSQLIVQKVTDYINELDKLSDTDKFTINHVEEIWKKLSEDTGKIYADTSTELLQHVNEKELIRKKKRVRSERNLYKKR